MKSNSVTLSSMKSVLPIAKKISIRKPILIYNNLVYKRSTAIIVFTRVTNGSSAIIINRTISRRHTMMTYYDTMKSEIILYTCALHIYIYIYI